MGRLKGSPGYCVLAAMDGPVQQFYWRSPVPAYDPARARQFRAEARGLDAVALLRATASGNLAEAPANHSHAVGG